MSGVLNLIIIPASRGEPKPTCYIRHEQRSLWYLGNFESCNHVAVTPIQNEQQVVEGGGSSQGFEKAQPSGVCASARKVRMLKMDAEHQINRGPLYRASLHVKTKGFHLSMHGVIC